MIDLNKLELEILEYWKKENTFKKSVNNRKSCEPFVIYEGPPTANGKPGLHHVLTRTFKDAVARFQTMNGRYVERTAGWDEHGLPVEIEAQKELNLPTKESIEDYGVMKFNSHCNMSTVKYITDWENLTERMGYWLDFGKAYFTSGKKYISRVQDVLGKLLEDGLIYRSLRVVPWACDSGTVVSNSEVAQGYKKVKHTAAYVLFRQTNGRYLLAWTTTPWTLPANMALAVNEDLNYTVNSWNGHTIISLGRLDDDGTGSVIGSCSGKSLVGQEYYHPFTDRLCPIVSANFVKAEKTGIVHIAPAFGQDDYELWEEGKIGKTPITCHIDADGKIRNSPSQSGLPGKLAALEGKNVLANNFEEANKEVLRHVTVFKTESYEHDYPHNWRTGKPLINYLRPCWYLQVNKIRKKMIEANSEVNWFPEHIKDGRFGEWLRGNVDWAISRERFWGTPLPFYTHSINQEVKFFKPDQSHKPGADAPRVIWRRTPEVLDCWFDSGAMPFAAYETYQQADCICEAIDQTRGWFYTLLVIGVALKGEAPFKNVLCLGHILDKRGQKMSKSKNNVVDPWVMFDKYGADAVRWYMLRNPIGNSLTFNEADIKSVVFSFINRLWNSVVFFDTYAKIDNPKFLAKDLKPIDEWLLAKQQELVNSTHEKYESYDFAGVVSDVEAFVNTLSNVWIRANRSRFWNVDEYVDEAAFYTLKTVLVSLAKIIAPLTPFLAEMVWKKLIGVNAVGNGSVHCEDMPQPGMVMNKELLDEMDIAQRIVYKAHRLRDDAGIKVRQVLKTLYTDHSLPNFLDYVKNEINVKEVIFREGEVSLDTNLTDDLINECWVREFVHMIQGLRKDEKFNVTDRINIKIDCDLRWKVLLMKNRDEIGKKLLVKNWSFDRVFPENKIRISDYVMNIGLEKVSESA